MFNSNYLDQLRDKRYESGPDSLTDEEKEALANDVKINGFPPKRLGSQ